MRPQAITITERAKQQIYALLQQRKKPALGIRVGLKTKGCNGMAYAIEYADEELPYDEVIPLDNFKLFIDGKAVMFLIGMEMDYKKTKLEEGFSFENPNEKGRCGCGKSFHV